MHSVKVHLKCTIMILYPSLHDIKITILYPTPCICTFLRLPGDCMFMTSDKLSKIVNILLFTIQSDETNSLLL